MSGEDDDDAEGIGLVGMMSEKLASEAMFWRVVIGARQSLSEVDKWTLGEMRLAIAYMDMQNDYKRVWKPYYDSKKDN